MSDVTAIVLVITWAIALIDNVTAIVLVMGRVKVMAVIPIRIPRLVSPADAREADGCAIARET